VPRFLCLLVAVLLAVASASSSAQQHQGNEDAHATIEIVGSLWCDTPDQLETVLRSHFTDKVPMGAAMAAINQFSPEACVVARAIVHVGSEVRRVTAGDNLLSLYAADVRGIMQGRYALMMRPQTWYGVRLVAELTPL
jgi:hypothetical protein